MWITRRGSDRAAAATFPKVAGFEVLQLYIFCIYFPAPGVTTWRDMSGNTRKNQVTRLVTLRHHSSMSGALDIDVRLGAL
jgi:hypothetical protein